MTYPNGYLLNNAWNPTTNETQTRAVHQYIIRWPVHSDKLYLEAQAAHLQGAGVSIPTRPPLQKYLFAFHRQRAGSLMNVAHRKLTLPGKISWSFNLNVTMF